MLSQSWGGEEDSGESLKAQEKWVRCSWGGKGVVVVQSCVGIVKVVLIMDY